MDTHARPLGWSKYARLAVVLVYAAALLWLVPESSVRGPILFIGLGLPLVFRLVPRNILYGERTPRTLLTTEDSWYRQNVITGVAMVIIGVIWFGVLATR